MRLPLITSLTVKVLAISFLFCPILSQAQMEPVGMEARIVHFMDDLKNSQTESLKAEIEQRQLASEQNKAWNVTHIQTVSVIDDQGLEKRAEKIFIRSFSKPVKNSFKEEEKKIAKATQGELKANKNIDLNRQKIKEEVKEELIVRWKVKPEKMRGNIEANYKGFSTEAQYAVNGRKQVSTGATIKDLGITTKVSYEFSNHETIASVDKKITDTVTAKVSRATASSLGTNETKAEIFYSQSF
jgi:hypothetical protein